MNALRVALILATCFAGQAAEPAPPDRLVFAEARSIRIAGPASREFAVARLPKQFSAGEYSPDLIRRSAIPSMGGSIAVGDFDGDGQPDLYVSRPGGPNSLLWNNGDGAFRDVTAKARVPGRSGGLSATFADYDHSGRLSLFVVGSGGIVLYHNNGDGTFSDLTERAGLRCKAGEIVTRAVLSDIDADGFPDLLLTLYADLEHPPAKLSFVFPDDFSGGETRLYWNDRHGAFTDVTAAAGLAGNPGRARNALIADFNGDHRPDILILRDDKPPALYLNQGDGRFTDASWKAGQELTGHAFFDGAVADFNGDGKPDLALWSNISFRLLLNRGNAAFQRVAGTPMPPPPPSLFGFHGIAADLNGNETPDLLSLDQDGRWHALVSERGQLDERPMILEAAEPCFSTVCPIRLKQHLYLLALRANGTISVFDERSHH